MRVMFVVINADDLGLHPAVTRAVEELAGRGRLTSASLLVNGPCAGDAGRLAGLGIGLHLNLLRGVPLGPPSETSTFTGADGVMLGRYAALFSRYLRGALDLGQVRLEWARQIERALEMGIALTHLDSEKHIHAWPGMMAVAGRLAERYGIRWVRRPRECAGLLRFDKGGLRTKFLNVCALMQKKPEAVSWPDRIWGIADQGERLLPDAFKEYMAGSNDRVVEICCHPGDPHEGDPPLPVEFGTMRVGSQWSVEFDRLADPRWRDVLREMDARLVHYGQIRPEDIE
jgi:predicted glycoside hydrolase/deacetylase ChbG (UPF0249 family)